MPGPSRKRDKHKVKSLWHSFAPAAWAPVDLDESEVQSRARAYSLRELQQMASQMGIDPHLSKLSLARCIVAEKNIFFPNEAGVYEHDTLVFFVRQFQVLPDLSDEDAQKMTNVELQSALLSAWKGGTDEAMNINLQHVIELYEIMEGIEEKFCSTHIKKLFREPQEDGSMSLREYTEKSMTAVLELYQKWLSESDTKSKRKVFVATQIAYANAEAAVTNYLRLIRKHCKTASFYDCDAENIPPLVMNWMRTSDWDDRVIMCNVTVKGRLVEFVEGDELLPGYVIGVAVRVVSPDKERAGSPDKERVVSPDKERVVSPDKEKENVVWLGIGKPQRSTVHPEPRPLTRHAQMPDYSRPYDSIQLGRIIDLYERHPTPQPRQIYRPVQQPIQLSIQQQQPQPVQQPIQQPVPEPTGPGFREKAVELAKELSMQGMDVAGQLVWAGILGALFPMPGISFTYHTDQPVTNTIQIGAGEQQPETQSVDVATRNPVPPPPVVSTQPVETRSEQFISPGAAFHREVQGGTIETKTRAPGEPVFGYVQPTITVEPRDRTTPFISHGTAFPATTRSLHPETTVDATSTIINNASTLFSNTTHQGVALNPVVNVTIQPDPTAEPRYVLVFNSSNTIDLEPNPRGPFTVERLIPGVCDAPELQTVPNGTILASDVFRGERKSLETIIREAGSSLAAHTEQLASLSGYQPEKGATNPFLQVSPWFRALQVEVRKPDLSKRFSEALKRMMWLTVNQSMIVRPAHNMVSPTQEAATVSLRNISSTQHRQAIGTLLDRPDLVERLLRHLSILRAHSTSKVLNDASSRIDRNLRLLFSMYAPVRGKAPVTSPVPTPTLAPSLDSVRNDLELVERELNSVSKITPEGLATFARNASILRKSLVDVKPQKGIPYTPVRTVNIWDTDQNLFGLVANLSDDFIQTLVNMPNVIPGKTESSRQAQTDLVMAARWMQMIRSAPPSSSHPHKMVIVDFTTAFQDLDSDPTFHGFFQRYIDQIRYLVEWQNLHAQETYPWPASIPPSTSSRSKAVYAVINTDAAKIWPPIIKTIQESFDELQQAENHLNRLGSILNAVQLDRIHTDEFTEQIEAFVHFLQHAKPLATNTPKFNATTNQMAIQPDLLTLEKTTQDAISRAEKLAQVGSNPKVVDGVKEYAKTAAHFLDRIKPGFAGQTQTKVNEVRLDTFTQNLVFASRMLTVNIEPSKHDNAMAEIGRQTTSISEKDVRRLDPDVQAAVFQALEYTRAFQPRMQDTSELPVPYVMFDLRSVADLVRTDPGASPALLGWAHEIIRHFSTLSPTKPSTALTKPLKEELAKFPAVPVPQLSLKPSTPLTEVSSILPGSVRSPFDSPVSMRPMWESQGPVPVAIYTNPIIPRAKDTALESAQSIRVALSMYDISKHYEFDRVIGALDLWANLPDQQPLMVPDFSYLHQEMRKIFQQYTANPLPDSRVNQTLLNTTKATIKTIESSDLQKPDFSAVCPVMNVTTSNQSLVSFLGSLPPIPNGVDPSLDVLGALQSKISSLPPSDSRITVTLPDIYGWAVSLKTSSVEAAQVIVDAISNILAAWTRGTSYLENRIDVVNQGIADISKSVVDSWALGTARFEKSIVAWRDAINSKADQTFETALITVRDTLNDLIGTALVETNRWLVDNVGWLMKYGVWKGFAFTLEWTGKGVIIVGWKLVAEPLVKAAETLLTKVTTQLQEAATKAFERLSEIGFNNQRWQQHLARFQNENPVIGHLGEIDHEMTALTHLAEMLVSNAFTTVGTFLTTLDLRVVGNVLSAVKGTLDSVVAIQISLIQGMATGYAVVKSRLSSMPDEMRTSMTGWLDSTGRSAKQVISGFESVVRVLQDTLSGLTSLGDAAKKWFAKSSVLADLHKLYPDPEQPLTNPQDSIMGGFQRELLKQSTRFPSGEKLVPTERVRKDLKKFGIEAGTIYSGIGEMGASIVPVAAPRLVGTSTLPIEPLPDTRQVTKTSETHSITRALRKLRSSEAKRRESMVSAFRKRHGFKVAEKHAPRSVPSVVVKSEHPVDLPARDIQAAGLIAQFFNETCPALPKGHTVNTLKEHIQDQCAVTMAALLAEPNPENRSMVTLFSALDDGDLDTAMCLRHALSPVVHGQYNQLFVPDQGAFCLAKTAPPPSNVTKTLYVERFGSLDTVDTCGVLVDPNWDVRDAQDVRKGLRRDKFPSVPFSLVGEVAGNGSVLNTTPIFSRGAPVSALSLWRGASISASPQKVQTDALLGTLQTGLDLVQYGTTSNVTREDWEYIIGRSGACALISSTPLDTSLQCAMMVNSTLTDDVRLDEPRIRDILTRVYAAGPDPLGNEYFNVPFTVLPTAKVFLRWQKQTGHTSLLASLMVYEQNGIHGPALLTHFRDWIATKSPALINPYDRFLREMLQTNRDRTLILLDSARWLGENTSGNISVPSTLMSREDADSYRVLKTEASPQDFLRALRQSSFNQFGNPFSIALVRDIQEAGFMGQQFLNKTGTGGMLTVCALSVFARSKMNGIKVEITPALMGGLLLQANTTSLVCARLPEVRDAQIHPNRLAAWSEVTRIATNTSSSLPPYLYNFYQKPGECDSEQVVLNANDAHVLLNVSQRDITDRQRARLTDLEKRLSGLQSMVPDRQTAASLVKSLSGVTSDMDKFMSGNGATMTAYCWRGDHGQNPFLGRSDVSLLEQEFAVVLRGTDHPDLPLPTPPPRPRLFLAEDFAEDIAEGQRRMAKLQAEMREYEKRQVPLWQQALTTTKDALQVTMFLYSPIKAISASLVGYFIVTPARNYLTSTQWYQDTRNLLEHYTGSVVGPENAKIALTVTEELGFVVVQLAVGKFLLSFRHQELANHADLLRTSPLGAFLESSDLQAQLDVSGADGVVRNVVVSLQNPSIFEAAMQHTGTTREALNQFIQMAESVQGPDTAYTALSNLISTFRNVQGTDQLLAIVSTSHSTLQQAENVFNPMAAQIHHQMVVLTQRAMEQGLLTEAQIAVSHALAGMYENLASAMPSVRNVPGLHERLAQIPLVQQ